MFDGEVFKKRLNPSTPGMPESDTGSESGIRKVGAHKATVKVDPELERQINTAAADSKTVEAVLMLKRTPMQIAANAQGTTRLVEKVLKRVQEKEGAGAKQLNVLQNLGMFVVEAEPGFLRELIAQPEIAPAVANHQPDEAMTPPPSGDPATRAAPRQKARSSERTGRRDKTRTPPAKSRK